jgi:hypothetical protein
MLEKVKENLANNKEIYFRIKVTPGAAKTEIREEMVDGTIKIALAASPEKGAANKELLKYLAEKLEIRKYQIKIISGITERLKLIKVTR